MRYAIACAIGLTCFGACYHGLIWTFDQIGVHAHEYLRYPVVESIGRYDIGEVDQDLTLVGYALMAFAVVISVNVGAAFFRNTLSPWKTISERATAKAWWFISVFMVSSLSLFQLLFRRFNEGLPGLAVSMLEALVPSYTAWHTWKWWKKVSQEPDSEA